MVAPRLITASRYNVGERLKRAASRAQIANPVDAAVASGVTLTVSATVNATANSGKTVVDNPTLFRTAGGRRVASGSGTRIFLPCASASPANGNLNGLITVNADYNSWGGSVSVQTDSSIVQFKMFSGSTSRGYRVIVDGQYVSKTPTMHTAANQFNYVILDFSDVYKWRTIEIEVDATVSIASVLVEPTSNISARADLDAVTALWAGDSYGEGQGATTRSQGVAQTFARLVGISDMRQVAVGGTGYLEIGPYSKLREQIPRWSSVNSDVTRVDAIIIADGYNGRTNYTAAQVGAEAALAFDAVRLAFPTTPVFVLGPWAGVSGPSAAIIAIEAAILAAVAGRANFHFVPVSADASP